MGSAPSPPPAPDYQAAASATAAGNLQYAQYTTQANRPNVTTPYGTESWTNTGTASNPEYNENISLTPQTQAALNSQMNVQEGQSSLASELQPQVAATMAGGMNAPSYQSYMDAVQPLNESYSGFNPTASGVGSVNTAAPTFNQNTANAGIQAAYNSEMGLVQPQEQQQTQSTENQLKLQGLTPGTQAYNNAVQVMQSGQNQENTTIANDAVQTGTQEASTDYQNVLSGYNAGNTAQDQAYTEAANTYGTGQQAETSQQALESQEYGQALTGYQSAYSAAENNYLEPLNAMNAVESGQQVSEPSFPNYAEQSQTSGPNDLGAAEDSASYNQGLYNVEAQEAGQETQAGVSALGSVGMMAAMMAMSA